MITITFIIITVYSAQKSNSNMDLYEASMNADALKDMVR